MEELPEELQKIWNQKQFKKFLKNIYEISKELASKAPTDNSEEEEASKVTVEAALRLLPNLWENKSPLIHNYIKEIYSLCEKFEFKRTLATSCNEYVKNVFCTEFMEHATFASIQHCLDISTRVFIELGIEQELKLMVEDKLRQELREWNEGDEINCCLQRIALEFSEPLPIFPITTFKNFPQRPHFAGVYLIYYVGETSLYGDLVNHSLDQPIYIGESEGDMLNRLSVHCRKLEDAGDLDETDFIVRFMSLDNKFYARGIEMALQDYHKPLWNDKSVQFSFGNGGDPNNNWYKYHISMDRCTIEEAINRVKDYKSK